MKWQITWLSSIEWHIGLNSSSRPCLTKKTLKYCLELLYRIWNYACLFTYFLVEFANNQKIEYQSLFAMLCIFCTIVSWSKKCEQCFWDKNAQQLAPQSLAHTLLFELSGKDPPCPNKSNIFYQHRLFSLYVLFFVFEVCFVPNSVSFFAKIWRNVGKKNVVNLLQWSYDGSDGNILY